MARKRKETKQAIEPPKVYCGECKHFIRDTSGISRNIDGEYFMGICTEGLHPDSPKKQFADKARKCETFKPKQQ
jgi:hypothetical protein